LRVGVSVEGSDSIHSEMLAGACLALLLEGNELSFEIAHERAREAHADEPPLT
jgi:hypothetical protein